MALRSPFTQSEIDEISAVRTTPALLLAAMRANTSALAWFGETTIHASISTFIPPTSEEENALGMLFYSILGQLKTSAELTKPYHVLVLAMNTRATLETCLDIAVMTEGLIDDPVKKFHEFTRLARFRAAEKRVAFYDLNPELEGPSDAEEARALVNRAGYRSEIETWVKSLWGATIRNPPKHWSGLDTASRATRAGRVYEEHYRRYWDLLSWYAHSGGAGVGGISPAGFQGLEVVCRDLTAKLVPLAYRQLGNALKISKSILDFQDKLTFAAEMFDKILVVDEKRKILGYPSRFESGFESLEQSGR